MLVVAVAWVDPVLLRDRVGRVDAFGGVVGGSLRASFLRKSGEKMLVK